MIGYLLMFLIVGAALSFGSWDASGSLGLEWADRASIALFVFMAHGIGCFIGFAAKRELTAIETAYLKAENKCINDQLETAWDANEHLREMLAFNGIEPTSGVPEKVLCEALKSFVKQ